MNRFCCVVLVVVLLVGISSLPSSGMSAASISQASPALDKIAPWVLEHTVDGAEAEFLVVLASQADLSGAAQLQTKAEKGRYVYETLWRTAQNSQAPLLAWLKARGVEYRAYYIVNLIWVRGNADLAQALAARSDVARIEGNPRIQNALPQPVPSFDTLLAAAPTAIEPSITYVRAPEVWAMGFTGQGIVVGGQDTGYEWTHPALQPHYRGWDGAAADHDYNWHDAIHSGGGSCGADSPVPCDDYSHGTHTMGTIVGDDGGTNQIGMAPGAQWIGCRNMDVGVGTPATYLECFEFFLAPYPVGGTFIQGDPSKAPDVTNNSWTCPVREGCSWSTLQAAVEVQRAAGIMTVVSAGNYGSACSTVSEPLAIYAAVYTVGALNTGTDTIASISSRGPVTVDGSNRRKPDIAAPGTSIRSCVPGGGYNIKTGTSMAAPHVAGAVALLWSADPALKNQITATEQLLNEAAFHIDSTDCSSSGWPNNTYGYGRLDVKAAVDAALATIQYGVTITPTVLMQHSASGQAVSSTFLITNTGMATDIYTVTLTGEHWQTTAPETIGPLSAGESASLPVTVTIPAGALPGASDGGTVTVTSTGDPARSAEATLITTADTVYGVRLWPPEIISDGDGGKTVIYVLMLTNTGNITDVYNLALSRATWPTTLTPTLVTLAPQATAPVTTMVTVPWDVFTGITDTARVTASGTGVSAYSDLTTAAIAPGCFPVIDPHFSYTPSHPAVGQTVTFTGTVMMGTPPVYYTWDFGDGSSVVTEQIVTHTFPMETAVLPYTVIMTATNACSFDAVQQVITVGRYTLYLPMILKATAETVVLPMQAQAVPAKLPTFQDSDP
jgi:serine protease AprX